jgi:hypothetical protein
MKTIQSAKAQGLIDDKQAGALTETAIRGMVGAGTTNPPNATTTQEVKELTEKAGEQNAAVKMTRPTGEQVEVDARHEGDGLSGAVSDLLGLGGGGKRLFTRPNRSTDLPLAIAKINAFRSKTNAGAWTNLDRAAVADRLIDLVNDPDKVNQGSIGVCGPAAFFNVWI